MQLHLHVCVHVFLCEGVCGCVYLGECLYVCVSVWGSGRVDAWVGGWVGGWWCGIGGWWVGEWHFGTTVGWKCYTLSLSLDRHAKLNENITCNCGRKEPRGLTKLTNVRDNPMDDRQMTKVGEETSLEFEHACVIDRGALLSLCPFERKSNFGWSVPSVRTP